MDQLVGHILVFVLVSLVFLLAPLIIGRYLRPQLPNPEKDAIYECGEPTIGSSYVQFDLRFYVVALLFIIFDVEIAFFFPWAMVYGGAMQLADGRLDAATRVELSERLLSQPAGSLTPETAITAGQAMQLGILGVYDILVFFGVLLVGFAYVWKRGDLDWVRAIVTQQARRAQEDAHAAGKTPATPDVSREPQPIG
jgi:NADH-quinone oxidoreductase subunit A